MGGVRDPFQRVPSSSIEDIDVSSALVTFSSVARLMFEKARRAARTPYPVLLVGPTGAGKTSLAALLHQWSPRASGPFVDRSLTTIPDELREAELYGNMRGAYTGATADRIGLLELAHTGTLFLDELGHASLGMQQLLLDAVEKREIRRLGDRARREVDVRFVFASSVDLSSLVARGRMLEELVYRVAGIRIDVPPLRDRVEDIGPLTEHFLAAAFRELVLDFDVQLTDRSREALRAHDWPGNVRELRSVCRTLAMRAAPGQPLDVDLVSFPGGAAVANVGASSPTERLLAALERAGGNKARAARLLGMSRSRLYRLLDNLQP